MLTWEFWTLEPTVHFIVVVVLHRYCCLSREEYPWVSTAPSYAVFLAYLQSVVLHTALQGMSGEFPGTTHACVIRRVVYQYDDCIHFSACQWLACPPGCSPDPASPVLEFLFQWTKPLWVLNQILYNQSPRKLLQGICLFYSPGISTRVFFRSLCFIREVNFICYWKICDFMDFKGGIGLVGLFRFFLRLMQEKIDK